MALPRRSFALSGAGATQVTGPGGLYGINVRENAAVAAVATLQVYDNTSAAGTLIATIRLAADGEFQMLWDKGVRFSNGLHVVATGDIGGSLLIGSTGALRALPFAGVDLQLSAVPAVLDSVLAAETAGAVAEWQLFDALTATGTPIAGAAPAANETMSLKWPPGMQLTTGLFFDNLAGATSGNAYVY